MKRATRIYAFLFVVAVIVQALMPDAEDPGTASQPVRAASHESTPAGGDAGARDIITSEGLKSAEEVATMYPDSEDYVLVPPVQRPFLDAWSGLKTLDHVLYPVYGVFESMDAALAEKGIGNVMTEDISEDLLYVQGQIATEYEPFHAVYTDGRLIDEGTVLKQLTPLAYLQWAIHDEFAAGVAFNPASRVCDKEVFNYFINKHGVAELIGFLQADESEDRGQPFHELAVAASARGDHYQVLYYWARSFREGREGDDWIQAELAKVRAYDAVDYPGSKQRAIGELEWFIDEHGTTPERAALLASLRRP